MPQSSNPKPITKAVIPAAGMGTRFLPATKAMPKEMLPVVDKPAIQYVVEEAAAAGLTEIMMITGRNKRALEDHFDRAGRERVFGRGTVDEGAVRAGERVRPAGDALDGERVGLVGSGDDQHAAGIGGRD